MPGAYPPYGEGVQADRRGELLDDVRGGYGEVQDQERRRVHQGLLQEYLLNQS